MTIGVGWLANAALTSGASVVTSRDRSNGRATTPSGKTGGGTGRSGGSSRSQTVEWKPKPVARRKASPAGASGTLPMKSSGQPRSASIASARSIIRRPIPRRRCSGRTTATFRFGITIATISSPANAAANRPGFTVKACIVKVSSGSLEARRSPAALARASSAWIASRSSARSVRSSSAPGSIVVVSLRSAPASLGPARRRTAARAPRTGPDRAATAPRASGPRRTASSGRP